MSVTYILAAPSDEKALLRLRSEILKCKVSKKAWDWEFCSFPEKTVFAIAKDAERIVGTYFFLPVFLNHGGRQILSCKGESVYIDPEYRGTGVFESLWMFATEQCFELDATLLWGFSSAAVAWKKLSRHHIREKIIYDVHMDLSVEVDKKALKKRSSSHLSYWARLLVDGLRVRRNKRTRHLLMLAKESGSLHKEDRLRSFSDMDLLYAALRRESGTRFHLSMSERYLNWRVYENPYIEYATSFFYDQAKLCGYYIHAVDDGTVCLSDFTSLSSETSRIMLAFLIEEMGQQGVSECCYFGNYSNKLNKRTFDLFTELGGERRLSDWATLMFSYNLDPPPEGLFNTGLWYINGLWTEGRTI